MVVIGHQTVCHETSRVRRLIILNEILSIPDKVEAQGAKEQYVIISLVEDRLAVVAAIIDVVVNSGHKGDRPTRQLRLLARPPKVQRTSEVRQSDSTPARAAPRAPWPGGRRRPPPGNSPGGRQQEAAAPRTRRAICRGPVRPRYWPGCSARAPEAWPAACRCDPRNWRPSPPHIVRPIRRWLRLPLGPESLGRTIAPATHRRRCSQPRCRRLPEAQPRASQLP